METTNPTRGNGALIAKTVCGGTARNPSGYPSAMFHDETVYFCNNACLKAFLLAPEAFMAGEIEHPLEDADITEK